MERISATEERKSLLAEHHHRYALAAEVATGKVLDVSCGVGYGAPILSASKSVKEYTGVDISPDAVAEANQYFAAPKTTFQVGDITNLQFEDGSFDTVVSFETLEHLKRPDNAFAEIKRVLKAKQGIFIGSVPTEIYDAYCESVFGPNEFHLARFSQKKLEKVLHKYFRSYKIFTHTFEVGSVLDLVVDRRFPSAAKRERIEIANTDANALGSYLFIATDNAALLSKKKGFPSHTRGYQHGVNFAQYSEKEVIPVVRDRDRSDRLVAIRDRDVRALKERISDIERSLETAEKMVRERDGVIASMEKMVRERDSAIASIIADRDNAIDSYEKSVKEKLSYIAELEEGMRKRWDIIQEYDQALGRSRALLEARGLSADISKTSELSKPQVKAENASELHSQTRK